MGPLRRDGHFAPATARMRSAHHPPGVTMASYPSSLKSARRVSQNGLASEWREFNTAPPLASAPPAFSPSPLRTAHSDASNAEVTRSEGELARMIESEIIPRLMLAHRAEPVLSPIAGRAAVGPRTLDTFIRMSLARDVSALTAFIETLMEGGLPLDEVYVDLLIPTARRLGEGWEDDTLSYTDVTVALSRLHQVLRALAWRVPSPAVGDDARAICLSPFPGSQHTFGLAVLEDGFRRAGWRTWFDPHAGAAEAVETVALEWYDVFGLGVACDTPLAPIAALVGQVRAASCNPDLFVMVGGRLFADRPELARDAGADGTACDTRDALLIADKAVRARAFG